MLTPKKFDRKKVVVAIAVMIGIALGVYLNNPKPKYISARQIILTSEEYPIEYSSHTLNNFPVDTVKVSDTIEIISHYYSKDYEVFKIRTKKGKTGYTVDGVGWHELKAKDHI